MNQIPMRDWAVVCRHNGRITFASPSMSRREADALAHEIPGATVVTSVEGLAAKQEMLRVKVK